MNAPPTRVPDFLLERLALGELSSTEEARLRARLAAEEGGLARLEAIENSNTQILTDWPASQMVPRLEQRLHLAQVRAAQPRRKPWASARPALAAAAVAVAALLVFLPPANTPTPENPHQTEPGGERLKGLRPKLHVFQQRGVEQVELSPGSPLSSHDLIQLTYQSAGQGYGVILSVDGRGAVTLHHPLTPDGSTALTTGGEVALPRSYELDDAPEFERFFLVTAPEPIDTAQVLRAADALRTTGHAAEDPLPLPPDLEQTAFLLAKVQP